MNAKKGLAMACLITGLALSATAQNKRAGKSKNTSKQTTEQQVPPEPHNSRKLEVSPAPQHPATTQSQQATPTQPARKIQQPVQPAQPKKKQAKKRNSLDPNAAKKGKQQHSTEKASKGKK